MNRTLNPSRFFSGLLFLLTCLALSFRLSAQVPSTDTIPGSAESGFRKWLTEKPAGLYNATTFAVVSEQGNLFPGMQTSFGYRFNPWIALGGGAGIERYTDLSTYGNYSANFTLMPVFAEVRYTMIRGRVSPVAALQAGYKFLINTPSSQAEYWRKWIWAPYAYNDYESYDTYTQGGAFAALELGVNWKVYRRFGLTATVSYSMWSVSGDTHLWRTEVLAVGSVPKVTVTETTSSVLAYQNIFLFRLGFSF